MSFRTPTGRILGAIFAICVLVYFLPTTPEVTSFMPSMPSALKPAAPATRTLQDRMALSEKSWLKSVDLRGKMATAHPENPQIPFFPAQTLPDFGKYPYTLWDFFPPTWTCPHDIQRVGRLGDGGKWVCGMSLYESIPASPSAVNLPDSSTGNTGVEGSGLVIYSFGINGESSFEAEMLERIPSAAIWGYDFSVSGWGPQIPSSEAHRTFFKPVGLGATDEVKDGNEFFTLQSLMKQNNHTHIDILKVDIEGSEYTAWDSIMDAFENIGDGILPIGQVMIELHVGNGEDDFNFGRFRKWWERLEKMGMRPTWMEINLMAVTLGRGKTNPRCTEYVWVNPKDTRNVLWKE
ncbi:hypothetical protein BS50DRAFT_512604 [Corynespora cassiicola Philippines]|uniref:Methyltransferase domain-containing protein n=1 Tax=Corynespora cassiicola Philippines TaxID=1448308 RepID=A0A2T2PBS6_CORCC|nr:hypothetical protein BS50DRAFT_512604 [Corynespora cassiicola Philippines]